MEFLKRWLVARPHGLAQSGSSLLEMRRSPRWWRLHVERGPDHPVPCPITHGARRRGEGRGGEEGESETFRVDMPDAAKQTELGLKIVIPFVDLLC